MAAREGAPGAVTQTDPGWNLRASVPQGQDSGPCFEHLGFPTSSTDLRRSPIMEASVMAHDTGGQQLINVASCSSSAHMGWLGISAANPNQELCGPHKGLASQLLCHQGHMDPSRARHQA